QTVGDVTGTNRALRQPLRQGLLVTAVPRGSNIILRFEADRSDTHQRYTIAEVPISADLGSQFFEFAKAALASAETVFAAEQFAQPWQVGLTADSDSGGQVSVTVEGDAMAH